MTQNESMSDKIIKLGFDPDIFLSDVLRIDDKLNFNYSDKNMEDNVYPYLRFLKEKYGMNIPLNITGVDIVRLDNMIDSILYDRRV